MGGSLDSCDPVPFPKMNGWIVVTAPYWKVWTPVISLVRVGNDQRLGRLVDNSDISTGSSWTLAASSWTLVAVCDPKSGRCLVIPWTLAMKLIENLIFLLVACERKSPNGHQWIT